MSNEGDTDHPVAQELLGNHHPVQADGENQGRAPAVSKNRFKESRFQVSTVRILCSDLIMSEPPDGDEDGESGVSMRLPR